MLRYPCRKRHKHSIQLCESSTLVIKTALLSEFRAKSEKIRKKGFFMETPFHILSLTGAGDFRQRRHLALWRKGAATTDSTPSQRV